VTRVLDEQVFVERAGAMDAELREDGGAEVVADIFDVW
jgi:hypothetical protein